MNNFSVARSSNFKNQLKFQAFKILCVALAIALTLAFLPVTPSQVTHSASFSKAFAEGDTSQITIDGSIDEWAAVATIDSTVANVDYWQICKDEEGNVYLAVCGEAYNQWESSFLNNEVGISNNGLNVDKSINSGIYSGWSVAYRNLANGGTPGLYYIEAKIPASNFVDADAIISFAGSSIPLSAVPAYSDELEVDSSEAVYAGIVIDGKFSDWAAVTKYDAECPNDGHPNCLEEAALVFDGQWVYCYLSEAAGSIASSAGGTGDGWYAITTDLGRQLVFQLKSEGVVSGVSGATCSHVGRQWEIAIPASELPSYSQTISFGLNLTDPFVSDVANLQESDQGGQFDGQVVIDGLFGDWEYYPVTVVEYQGTASSGVADAYAALYSQNSTLYGYAFTNMADKIASQGGCMLAAVSIAFNNDRNYKSLPADGNFYPKFYSIDASGNVTVANEGTHLEPSATPYVFYISDTRAGDQANPLNFGKLLLSVTESGIECEFELDLEKVAEYIGADAADFKTIEIQWGKLGQQWVTYTGTSTGPILGVLLCVGSVAGVLAYRRQRTAKSSK